jgi:hypothetical protein
MKPLRQIRLLSRGEFGALGALERVEHLCEIIAAVEDFKARIRSHTVADTAAPSRSDEHFTPEALALAGDLALVLLRDLLGNARACEDESYAESVFSHEVPSESQSAVVLPLRSRT